MSDLQSLASDRAPIADTPARSDHAPIADTPARASVSTNMMIRWFGRWQWQDQCDRGPLQVSAEGRHGLVAAAAAALALRPLKSESNFFTTMVETLTGEETSLSDTAGDVSKQKGTEKTNASMFLLLS